MNREHAPSTGAMVGAGAWSRTQLEAWQRTPGARIVAIADRLPERCKRIAADFCLAEYESVAQMLAQERVDFLDICTRPDSHSELVRLAVARGLPVLCQKPFCSSYEEAESLVQLCAEARIPLMVNENFRWQPYYRKVKELLSTGELGEPFAVTMHQRHRLTMPRFDHYQSYFTHMPRLAVYEVGTHLIDTLRFLFGDPDTVYARLHTISPDVKGEDVQTLVFGYGSRLTVNVIDSWASVPISGRKWFPRLLEVDCPGGTIYVDKQGSVHLFRDSGAERWDFPADAVPQSHTAALTHFIQGVREGGAFETGGAETLKTMKVVYACYESHEKKQVVGCGRAHSVRMK